MTTLALPRPEASSPACGLGTAFARPATDAATALLRPGALLHRARLAAAAVWSLAPGRYLAIPDGEDVVVLRLGRLTRIGRRVASDIVLDDPAVSRRHALVLERDGAPVIADDRSRNGVYVNGKRVREARLRHGDEVRIGTRVMRFLEV